MVFGCSTVRTPKESRIKKTSGRKAEASQPPVATPEQQTPVPAEAGSIATDSVRQSADTIYRSVADTMATAIKEAAEAFANQESGGTETTGVIPGSPEEAAAADSVGTTIPEDIPYEDEVSEGIAAGGNLAAGSATNVAPSTGVSTDDSTTPSQGVQAPAGGGQGGLFSMPRRSQGQQSGADSSATAPGGKSSASRQQQQGGDSKFVQFTGNTLRRHNISPDSFITTLVGGVVIYHNGAVITCDSAVRYSDQLFDCFKRVIINRGTTYIYGDRAEYNDALNTATVFAPIIKMVDEDATLYTYRLSFNTLDNVARYGGGGTLTQKDNMMESKRGYYFADNREFVGVDSVQVSNPDYRMMSDSAAYNIDTETASFFTRSIVWNDKGEILTAERGTYHSPSSTYNFLGNSYIVTPIREVWADELEYNSTTNDVVMHRDIQFVDDEQHTMAFGDYAEYWGESEQGMLTLNPSLLSFDPQQPDTLYMRSDSMFMYTFSTDIKFKTTMRPGDEQSVEMPGFGEEEMIMPSSQDETPSEPDTTEMTGLGELPEGASMPDSLGNSDTNDLSQYDNALLSPDTADKEADVIPDKKALKRAEKERRRIEKEERREERRTLRDSITSGAYARNMHDHECEEDCDHEDHHPQADSVGEGHPDSTYTDPTVTAVATDSTAAPQDSLQRVFIGYRDVRVYRNDFQAVCDSLVGFSIDSTMHMYINPILWSGSSQIFSDVVDVFVQNEQLHKAEFFGSPFAAAEVQEHPGKYNQVKGKFMEAWFRDNEIYKHDVLGNGQCYYWMQDDETKDITTFLTMLCADMSFVFEEQELDKIKYYTDLDYKLYPPDEIPADQNLELEGFAWHADRQPQRKEDVFNRAIRPSQREEYLAIPEPEFPLSDRIIKHKESMIQRGIWRERNDQLSPEAIEYINNIKNPLNKPTQGLQ